jgi:O-antigen/teichoic acid export membrane protein
MLLFRFAEKSLGLISTVVLARSLVPEDFGLVAMAMSIISLVELASSFSFETVLIQQEQPTRAHYDTAWTLNVLFGAACALVMIALAKPAAGFYSEPRLVAVVCVIASGWVLQSLENVGVVDFRRQMDFRKEFAFLALKKAVGFVVTIILAFTLRNYWALVAGMMAGRLTGVVSSYVMSPFRPRFGLAARRELFRFSSWLLVANIVNFAETRFAHFFVGRVEGPAPLGLFTIASDFASLPTTELSAPINRAAFPGYSRLAGRRSDLQSEVTIVIGMLGLSTIPAALGLMTLAEPLVRLVLGEKWMAIVPVLQVLVVAACLRAVMSNYHAVFLAVGRPHLSPVLEGFRVAVMIPLTFVLAEMQGLVGVAVAQAISMSLGFIASSVVLVKVLELPWRAFSAQLLRPTLASLVMVAIVHMTSSWLLQGTAAAARLAVGVAVGVATFVLVLGAVWLVSGRPAGAELTLVQWAGRMSAGWARRRSGGE